MNFYSSQVKISLSWNIDFFREFRYSYGILKSIYFLKESIIKNSDSE